MSVDRLLQALREILANPTSNLTVTVLLLAAVALILLILVLAALLLVMPKPSRRARGAARAGKRGGVAAQNMDTGEDLAVAIDDDDEDAPEGEREAEPDAASEDAAADVEPPAPDAATLASSASAQPSGAGGSPRRTRLRLTTALIAGLVIAAVAASYVVTAQDFYCLSCHASSAETGFAEGRGKTSHDSVACVQCHEDDTAVVTNTIARLTDIGAKYGPLPSGYQVPVASERCLDCHADRLKKTFVDPELGVAMSHVEPVRAGWTCLDCHYSPRHASMKVRTAMTKCLSCHDSKVASAKCDTCHKKDAVLASTVRRERVFPKVELVTRDCEGCHDSARCDACHKIRMPHSDAFFERHAKYAAFEKKALCFEKCHTSRDCGGCHAPFDKGHVPNWKQEHKKLPKDSICGTCHKGHSGSICDVCHDF